VVKFLQDGYRTIDIMPHETSENEIITQVGTAETGDRICERITGSAK